MRIPVAARLVAYCYSRLLFYFTFRGVDLKKKWGRLKQDLDKDLQLHRILILL